MADSEESRQKQHLQILSAMAEQAHYNHLKQFHSLGLTNNANNSYFLKIILSN
jgi:hypothetical protein